MALSAETAIVLAAGAINYTHLPIGTSLSNAMIPVNGKPTIGWVLDDLLSKGISRVTVVLQQQNERLRSFLEWAYDGRAELTLAMVPGGGTILDSLRAGLDRSAGDGLVRVVLGDTLITDRYEGDDDFVYVGAVADSSRWCLAVTNEDGTIAEYVDKQALSGGTQTALAGYYHLLDGRLLRSCLDRSLDEGGRELSHVLLKYGAVRPITARLTYNWLDFGHIDHLVEAKQRLLRPRAFNTLSVDPVLGTIRKVSEHDEKLQDELDWYLALPDGLKVLAPRIVKHARANGRLEIVQEYYGYPTLAELYVYGDLNVDIWLSILRRLFLVHRELASVRADVEKDNIVAMYSGKTWERLEELGRQDPVWSDLLSRQTVVFNGKTLRPPSYFKAGVDALARSMAADVKIGIVHGDFCFSNILFDMSTQVVKLIDPRGSFGGKGIFGDPRYDVAKLRHSVCGLYDFIVADLFRIRETGDGFEGSMLVQPASQPVAAAFDRYLAEAGYDALQIRFLEALLFLSMVPLHRDSRRRQTMMYLTGLNQLNEVMACGS